MDEYMPIGDTGYVRSFEIYHINEEISHSKCHISNFGSCTCFHSISKSTHKNQLHQNSTNIFLPVRFADNECEKY